MIAAAGSRVMVFYYSDPGGGLRMRQSVDGAKTFQPSVIAGDGAYADLAVAPSGAQGRVFRIRPLICFPEMDGGRWRL